MDNFLITDRWRCCVGARKLPREGHSVAGLAGHLPLPYIKLIYIYVCLIFAISLVPIVAVGLSVRRDPHVSHRGLVAIVITSKATGYERGSGLESRFCCLR